MLSLAKEILTALIVKVDIVELWGRSATTNKNCRKEKPPAAGTANPSINNLTLVYNGEKELGKRDEKPEIFLA